MRIALAGNPNSGKTTMYNALTGRREKIGNWAGVTVDSNASLLKKSFYAGNEEIIVVDLPGAYSMSPFTAEESITSAYIKNENPDVLINIVDATNLSRSLFFTTQLLELRIPMVVALNKSDINEKKETVISTDKLSSLLGCPVIDTVSTSNNGLAEVINKVISLKGQPAMVPFSQADVDLSSIDAVKEADRKRFEFVKGIVDKVETRKISSSEITMSDRLDVILTHPVWGMLIFALAMFLVFFISQSTLGSFIADYLSALIEIFQEYAGKIFEGANPLLYALLIDGIIGGVGAVIGFLPLVMIMYFLIALLEDCGYMSRATVVLDPIFKKVGLSGKSVIPMVMGTGCGIPAIMSCRTIKNEREKRASAMLATFMPCGAKLPVIALFAGAFFKDAAWVGPLMYFVGIALILLGALLVRAITGAKKTSYFIIELPDYKVPSFKFAFDSMLERGKSYIVKAGTVILVCNSAIQIMQSFDMHLHVVEKGNESSSILAIIATPFSVLLIPVVGFAAWQLAAAAITGFIAKENVVGTLATVYAITNFIDTEELSLAGSGSEVAATIGLTKAAALAYLMFNLYSPPCVAALAALNSELQSRRWFLGAICFQLVTGFSVGFFVFQIGTLITTGSFGAGFLGGLTAVVAFGLIVAVLTIRASASKKQ